MFNGRWSGDEISQVMDLWGKGESIEDIAGSHTRSPCAIAYKVLSDRYASTYQTLWAMKKQSGDSRPVVSIAEIVSYLEEQEEKGGAARCVNSGGDGRCE